MTKKEAFQWLTEGTKTIDIRKGNLRHGGTAIYQSGPCTLRLKIVKTQTGYLREIVRKDNFLQVIPSAHDLGDAIVYLLRLYDGYNDVFTAYYVEPL